jgi:hypothetical protein
MQAAVALGKMKRHFTGVVKTSHGLFPKAFLQKSLSTALARSKVHLRTTVEGVQLVATCYLYNRRKVLCFISTVGAGGVADGNPYIQRWADDNGNIVTRAISRPHVVSNYFERSPRVDKHNHSRQHELAIEEAWLTQDC